MSRSMKRKGERLSQSDVSALIDIISYAREFKIGLREFRSELKEASQNLKRHKCYVEYRASLPSADSSKIDLLIDLSNRFKAHLDIGRELHRSLCEASNRV